MRTSESTGQLMKALAEAQGKFPKITKDKTVETGKFSYSYADLASVLEVIRPVLAEHKIAVVQAPDFDGEGRFVLISRLAHESDEWIEGCYPLPNNASAQEMGSAITYARRYSACALAGVTAEDDDDGQRAGKPAQQKSKPAAQPAQQRTPAAVTPGSRDELIARLKKVLADDHPKKPLLSSMSDRQLEALAKSHSVTLDPDPAESPSPEGEGPGIERVDASPSPEGDWEAHWTMIAEVAGTNVQQIENLLRTLPGGKSIQSLKNLSPHSSPGQKLEKALIGNKKESAA